MTALDEAKGRHVVASLWVLLRTACSDPGGADAALQAAGAEYSGALAAVFVDAPYLVLQERSGALFANGDRVRPDVRGFAATAGVAGMMQEHGITEVLVMPNAGALDFVRLARCWATASRNASLEGLLLASGCHGIHVAQGDEPGPLLAPAAEARPQHPSRLGAMFTMQQLSRALDVAGPLSGPRAYAVVQAVVDRLLRSRSCLSPLSRVEREPLAHREAVRACVLAAETAESLGWSEERSAAAGAAALLGPASAAGGDCEVAELARAAKAVAALVDERLDFESVLDELSWNGQLSVVLADAMAETLAV